jgi:hypothetical protein
VIPPFWNLLAFLLVHPAAAVALLRHLPRKKGSLRLELDLHKREIRHVAWVHLLERLITLNQAPSYAPLGFAHSLSARNFCTLLARGSGLPTRSFPFCIRITQITALTPRHPLQGFWSV